MTVGIFRGTLLFSDVLNMGTKEHRLEMEQITKKLHFDQPINIQFTSVSIRRLFVVIFVIFELLHYCVVFSRNYRLHRKGNSAKLFMYICV